MNKKVLLALIILSLAGIFCTVQVGGTTTPTTDLSSSVNATLTALANPAATMTETLSTSPMSNFPTGIISGTLSYPADALPPERVVAWSTIDSSYYFVDTAAGQSTYQLGVPTGMYTVVAYSIGGGGFPSGLAGGYKIPRG